MGFVRFIAGRLSSPEGETGRQSRTGNILAWLSVCLSVAVMIVALTVVSGFKSRIRGRATGFMGSVMLVQPGQNPINEHYPFSSALSYTDTILSLKGVRSVDGVAYTSGLLKSDSEIEGLMFKGVDSLYNLSFLSDALVEGSLPDYSGKMSSDIMVSRSTASAMGYNVGDAAVVYFIGEQVRARKFRICGIFEVGMDEIDSRFALADIRQVRRINGWETSDVSSVEIHSDGSLSVEALSSAVSEIEFRCAGDDDAPLFVTNVKEFYGGIFDWLNLLDLNVLMILTLMIVVAGFNMISAVLIILFENISTIGLLKALGMTSSQVGKVFMLRAGRIVGKGMLLGNILGFALCLAQKYTGLIKLDRASYFVDRVPIDFPVGQLILLNVAAAALIMLFVSTSTLFISKVSPDKTLKME